MASAVDRAALAQRLVQTEAKIAAVQQQLSALKGKKDRPPVASARRSRILSPRSFTPLMFVLMV